ncbi:hypothetical protein ANCDUO_00667 [Ancylostoma duodenale]|uniref:Uncharacterized protein n=1 Tax=Ancylostoma duodenale TaxID=51022 RepID=A0A0C2E0Y1_9BILA|nr:hypothetical protein ANCDUO_00667 [Ancylostoma duodenale]
MLIIIPKEVKDAPIQTKTKRVRRRAKQKSPRTNLITVDHDGDTSPLGMFFTCSGRTREEGINYQFACTIRDKRFKDVANVNDDTIGELRFYTIYGLARLISIFETEKNEDRRRFLMKDEKYKLVTTDGMRKAFTFYKKYCDHVIRAIALHDGSRLNLPHDGSTGIPIEQLNDLNNEGVSFAKVHTWEEITVKLMTRKALLLLPNGFRSHDAVFESNGDCEIFIYEKISDMMKTLVDHESRTEVVVTPTTNTPIPKQEWMRLSTSIAKVALRGTKVVVVAAPRGEEAWEQNRIDAREMIEWAKNGATMSRNVIDRIPMLESVSELCHSVGKHCRATSEDSYPHLVVKDFLESLWNCVKGDISLDENLKTKPARKSKAARTREYFKRNRERMSQENKVHNAPIRKMPHSNRVPPHNDQTHHH